MGTNPTFLFRQLLTVLPRGRPIDIDELTVQGLSAKAVARLSEDGWLKRLSRGVYVLPGDKLDRQAALAWLALRLPALHVGGITALSWRGVRHHLRTREVLSLWG